MLKKICKVLPWTKEDPWYCKVIITVVTLLMMSTPFISVYLEVVHGRLPF